jgi:Zn-dependent protease
MGQDQTFWLAVIALLVLYLFLQTSSALRTVFTLVALLAAITVHECSHAWTASRLGDDTGRNAGRVTLNPLAHLDPLGTVMMLITALTGFGIGWGKPVPVAPWRLRYGPRVGHGIVSLAGPGSNLIAAVVWAGVVQLLDAWGGAPIVLINLFASLVLINILIAFFNLLPIPPLDGFGVLIGLLGLVGSDWASDLATRMEGWGRFGWMILFGVIIVSQFLGLGLLDRVLGAPAFALFDLLVG